MTAQRAYAQYSPHPDAAAIFAHLSRVSLLLEQFQHRAFDRFGLRFIDYSVLRVLQLEGPPYEASPTRLSELVVRSSGGMTLIIDRLEGAELVRRQPDPDDRRRITVRLTARGLRLVQRANRAWQAQKADLLKELGAAELVDIDRAVSRLLDVFTSDFEMNAG